MDNERPEAGTPEWTTYWRDRIEAAQRERLVVINGTSYRRIPYGEEFPNARELCRDCGVAHGQLHVTRCCVERCPKCKGQRISCDCQAEAVH